MAAYWTTFTAGQVLTAAHMNGVVDNFSDIAIFREEQASGTNAGTFTSGSYVKRTLNTTVVNNIASCTLTASVVSLPAGTYLIRGIATAYGALNGVQARIANTTDSTYSYGQSNYYVNGGTSTGNNTVETIVTITGTKNFELQHRCASTVSSNGLGNSVAFGNIEVYSQLFIARIA
jgi:hypothetical protein